MEGGFPQEIISQAKGGALSSSEGNKVDTLSKSKRKNQLDNLFTSSENAGTPIEPMRKRRKKDRKLIAARKGARSTEDSFQVLPLMYESLASGTLSLGVVYQVTDSQLIIRLPGGATGTVGARDISGPYTSYLENYRNSPDTCGGEKPVFIGLQKLFKVGQMVIVKVLTVNKRSDGHHDVKLSMKPEDIHGNIEESKVWKDVRLVGAIESKGDNGYEVDVGIKNVKAFLSFSEVENGRNIEIGELVYCKVLKQRKVPKTLKVFKKRSRTNPYKTLDLTNYFDEGSSQPSIDPSCIIPGMILNTLVKETNETGLKVACGMLTGFVHCDNIKHEWADTLTVQVHSKHRATVLYVLPNITTPYFTMQTDLCPFRSVIDEDVSKPGALVSARVQKVTSRGLLIHLAESNQRGLVTIDHLGENFGSKEEMAMKFKPNSGIECCVVSFSPFERMFICSLRKEIIESKIVEVEVLKLVEEYEKSGVGAKLAEDASDGWYWVSLMKHYASSGNVEKARAVGREGLSYSPILQKSDSSLEIWRALFSVELKFGSDATAKEIISEAIARTDDKYKCYQMAAYVYQNENRIQDAINIYKFQLLKEFGGKVETWINFAKLYFHNGQVENARDVFHSACNKTASENLNEAELTSKFALLEIYNGDVAKGSMMFETLLASQTTRVDIWMVYVQALIKMKEYDRARAVFTRIFERDWKPTEVRALLARYKTFENEHGDPSSKQNYHTAAVKVLGPSGLNVLGEAQQ